MGLLEFITYLLVGKGKHSSACGITAKDCFAVASRLFDRDTDSNARDEPTPVVLLCKKTDSWLSADRLQRALVCENIHSVVLFLL